MTPPFLVRTAPIFDRQIKKLVPKHPDLPAAYGDSLQILGADPYNRTRTHNIKKLQDVVQGSGQWRLRIGRWRFRYDIYGQVALLVACSLRREDTYR